MRTSVLPLILLVFAACGGDKAEMLQTCEGGNNEACFRNGMGALKAARPDFPEARKNFSTACMSSHHPASCNELAKLARDAKGGPADPARAADMFEIACKGGISSACVDLGVVLFEGQGVKKDQERAVQLFKTVCEAAEAPKECLAKDMEPGPAAACALHGRACTALGEAHETAGGVKKDLDRAMDLYGLACSEEYAQACLALGNLQATKKRRADVEAAVVSYGRACKLDARIGCFELATLHAEKKWPEASYQEAARFYQKACNIDPTRGCFEAAKLMETEKVKAREGEIEYLYNLACEHGHTEACTKRNLQ